MSSGNSKVLGPEISWNLPATQLVQGDEFEQICRKPVVHFLKTSQSSHMFAPDVAWYLPAAQLSHSAFTPDVALNLPSAQSVQTEAPAAEYLPAAQLVQTSLVCSGKPKNLPATQSVQTEAAAAEYVPATQLVQGDKFEQICRKPVVHFLKSPQAVGTS